MRRVYTQLLAVLILMTAAAVAEATINTNPIKLRIAGTPTAAKAWETYTGTFTLEAGIQVELTDIAFVGDGWNAKNFQAPTTLVMMPGQIIQVPFSAIPTDAEQPVGLSFKIGDREYTNKVPTGPDFLADKMAPSRMVPAADSKYAAADLQWPEKNYSKMAEAKAARDAGTPLGEAAEKGASDKARTIRVTGRITYDRIDNLDNPQRRVADYPQGIRVEAYDHDSSWDEFLDFGFTDEDGRFRLSFTWDPCYFCDERPDIYVQIVSENFNVVVETAWLEWNYTWVGWTENDYEGTDLDFGRLRLDGDVPAAHIFKSMNHASEVFQDHGYDMDLVDIQWPGDADFYNPYFNEIHISEDREWQESTHLHEYGHFWDDQFSIFPIPDYLNGICDDASVLGGHCAWCEEEYSEDVENESWAHYAGYVTGKELALLDPPPASLRDFELTQECRDSSGNPCACEPVRTEGFLTAFLIDVADENNENDGLYNGNFADVLTLGDWIIPHLADVVRPQSAAQWYTALTNEFPQYKEELWETAMNNRMDFDLSPPAVIEYLWSPTHDGLVDSPDRTVELKWTTPADDASGIAGYSYTISRDSPALPGTAQVIGDANFFNTPQIPVGTWYINMRTIDRSGKASDGYATYGPVTIREPYPADLIPRAAAGWDAPLLVYHTPYEDGPLSVPNLLLSNQHQSTYFAMGMYNDGESNFTDPMDIELFLDGDNFGTIPLGGASPFMEFTRINYGPIPIHGGRHTIGMIVDAGETVPELDEENNAYGAQYAWLGNELFPGLRQTEKPGDPLGGVAEFGGNFYNANGYAIQSVSGWSAVSVYAQNTEQDYDIRLHQPLTSITDGFSNYEAYSGQPAGALDAVLINSGTEPQRDWNVGIIGDQTVDPSEYSSYAVEHVTSEFFGISGTQAWNWSSTDRLSLWEFRVFTLDADDLTITLQTSLPSQDVQVAWFHKLFGKGTLDQAATTVTTDNTGMATMDISVGIAGVGNHCLAVYRDPKEGNVPLELELTIGITPPDLTPVTPDIWYAPLVPNSEQLAAGVYPDTLLGNAFFNEGTYFNQALMNVGGLDAGPFTSKIFIDGVPLSTEASWAGLSEGAVTTNIGTQRWYVRGGRHTISMHLDLPDSVLEASETNNIYGAQWVWSPLNMSYTTTTARGQPPLRLGGWDDQTDQEQQYYNCDGLRMPAPSHSQQPGNWQAVAVLPRDSSSVSVSLHDVAGGVKDGFSGSNFLVNSASGPGHLSYVLINNHRVAKRAFDVGVQGGLTGNGYYGRAVNSTDLGLNPAGNQGNHIMAALDFIHLYELELSPGEYTIEVAANEGNIDWGVDVHADSTGYRATEYSRRSGGLAPAAGWMEPAGVDEHSPFSVPVQGKYCIVVYRPKSVDIQTAGSYDLRILSGLSAVEDVPIVSRTGLESIYPNPFNPQTTISFALQNSGPVELEIYDVRGRKVRTLVSHDLPQGRHSELWNGTDDHGQSVSSGVYLVRLRADGTNAVKRMVLIE